MRYLKTLNGMFGGNWRLAAMAYNAGEYRILQALRRNGGSALETAPSSLSGLSPVTYAYVDKLHALACLLERAGDRDGWRGELDRSVPQLQAIEDNVITAKDRFTFHDLRAYYATVHKQVHGALPDMHTNPATTAKVYDRNKEVRRRAL